MTVEASDVVFAVDSIPAIFGITRDPFLVYTSNIFAILGLRALYFLISGLMEKWRYLTFGLALVLGFIGVKMLLSYWFHVPILVSLAVIFGILTGSALASIVRPGSARRSPDLHGSE
jgi:tellurite resistance protein TerC